MDTVSTIRKRIKTIREQKGLHQQDMAEMLNMTHRNYARVERGEHKILDVHLLFNICKILDVRIDQMLSTEDFPLPMSDVSSTNSLVSQIVADDLEYKKSIFDCLQQLSQIQQTSSREIMEILKSR